MPWIKGTDLTEEQRADVLRGFANRDTVESPWTAAARALWGFGGPTGGALPTDAEWIDAREFHMGTRGIITQCRRDLNPLTR